MDRILRTTMQEIPTSTRVKYREENNFKFDELAVANKEGIAREQYISRKKQF